MSVVIETSVGDITVDLFLKERPTTCLNFLKLCKTKFYNWCIFHKIEKNFIAQAGDPTATGRGGESIFCRLYGDQAKYFDAEFKPRLKHVKLGTLSMVNNGSNMNGSQFFLTLSPNLTYLDENHTVFGEVAEGFDALLKLNDVICDNNSRPYQDVRINHTVILHDPFDDPKGLEIPDASPEPTEEMLDSFYIRADEEIDDTNGKTAEEVEENIKNNEAKARATILEMVGDIPDADVKPPENVLFVCKLNSVTTSDDLAIIFSRFGEILNCEVIKDKKTGESLKYAFITFKKEKDCEAAYFKMDNVLIDDQRIHVDFSQSSSNVKQLKLYSSKKKNDGNHLIFESSSRAELVYSKKRKYSYDCPSTHKRESKYAESSRSKSKEDKHVYYEKSSCRAQREYSKKHTHSYHKDSDCPSTHKRESKYAESSRSKSKEDKHVYYEKSSYRAQLDYSKKCTRSCYKDSDCPSTHKRESKYAESSRCKSKEDRHVYYEKSSSRAELDYSKKHRHNY